MKKLMFSAFFCCSGFYAFAQENSIDDNLSKCLDNAVSTKSQRECISAAEVSWDANLNQNYKILMGSLPEEAKKSLQQSQRNWITFRDAEFKFINTINFEVKGGTMYHVNADQQRMNIVKKRAEELQEFVQLLDE